MSAPDPYREWDAAYVLGALEPAERRQFTEHLAGCVACRDAVAELAGMPGILGSVSADVASDLVAPAPAAEDVPLLAGLAVAARRSQVRRRSLLALAACGLVVGGVAAGFGWGALGDAGEAPPSDVVVAEPGDVVPDREVVLTPVGQSAVHASLAATAMPWGTDLAWSCSYPVAEDPEYASATYELVLVARDGTRTIAATWTASGGESTGLSAASAMSLAQIVRVEITVGAGGTALAAVDL